MTFACAICGFMTLEPEKLDDHFVLQHVDRSIEFLVERAFQEAIQIAELNKLWRLTA